MDLTKLLSLNTLVFLKKLVQALIDYRDWTATTSTVDNKRYITDNGKSPSYPLALNSGSGVYFNGVDQKIGSFIIPPTAVSMLYIKNGINYYTTTLINFSLTVPVGTYKDVYYFNRTLTQAEIDNNKNQPEQFFIDAKNDATCVLAMPMNESSTGAYIGHVIDYKNLKALTNKYTSSSFLTWNTKDVIKTTTHLKYTGIFDSFARVYGAVSLSLGVPYYVTITVSNYASGTLYVSLGGTISGVPIKQNGTFSFYTTTLGLSDHIHIRSDDFVGEITSIIVDNAEGIYPITNYTTASRTNALNIPYGLQNSKLIRDANGVISGVSDYLEFSGDSTAVIPFIEARAVNVNLIVYPTSNAGNILSGGVVLSASGLILNQDNIITLNNKTINSTVTIGSGFIGIIKEYKETLI